MAKTASAYMNEEQTCSPYFFVQSGDASVDRLPLKATDVEVNIAGVIADVRVTQTYCNEGTHPLEAIYVFPGSTRAAVYGMTMTIGERVIVANIEKKQEARQQYEQAKREGKSASLLEQQRPNVFQMNVANILPGDVIKVELRYTELLVPTDCQYEFVYPTVVGPRYPGSQAEGVAAESWVENPYLREDAAPVSTFDIHVALSTGLPVQKIACESHQTDISYDGASLAKITLKPSETNGGNRDYILKYRLAGGQIESGLLLYEGIPTPSPSQEGKENFFLLMAQPPEKVREDELPPREYIFIMDVSGSMGGFPMDIARTLLKDLIQHLGANDRFNLMQFSFGAKVLSKSGSVAVTETHVNEALKLLNTAHGSGGTEILPALKEALALPRTEGMSCSIVVITDGFVTVEPEVFDLIRHHLGEANLFAFGIGSSVNRHIIEGMAHVGGGEPFIVTNETEALAQAATLRRCLQSPVLANLKLTCTGFDAYDIEPPALPDVFAERPTLCFGKWRGERKGVVTLAGRIGEREYRFEADVSAVEPRKEHAALRYLWARQTIKLLGDYNKLQHDEERVNRITELGLTYSLLTDYTSFIAVDSEVRNQQGQSTVVNQPVPLPQGVSEAAFACAAPSPGLFHQMAAISDDLSFGSPPLLLRRDRIAVEEQADILFESDGGFSSAQDFDFEGELPLSKPKTRAIPSPTKATTDEKSLGDLAKGFLNKVFGSEPLPEERAIGGKTFRLQHGVWVDAAHTKQAALIRIRRDSGAYRDLLRAMPQLAVYFDAEERILVNLGAYSVEIAPDGQSDATPEELRRLVEAWNATRASR